MRPCIVYTYLPEGLLNEPEHVDMLCLSLGHLLSQG